MIIHIHDEQHRLTCPEDVHNILKSILATESPEDQDKEHFWVIMLDVRNKIKAIDLVSLGTLDSALVHPREVFRRAIAQGCAHLIIAHNHPSNDCNPSEDDFAVTSRLVKAGEILGIEVTDHIVTTANGFYSFKQSQTL